MVTHYYIVFIAINIIFCDLFLYVDCTEFQSSANSDVKNKRVIRDIFFNNYNPKKELTKTDPNNTSKKYTDSPITWLNLLNLNERNKTSDTKFNPVQDLVEDKYTRHLNSYYYSLNDESVNRTNDDSKVGPDSVNVTVENNGVTAKDEHLNKSEISQNDKFDMNSHFEVIENFNRIFYHSTFKQLLTKIPDDRRNNGISFVQSGLLLYMMLTSLSMLVDKETREEIEKHCISSATPEERNLILQNFLTWMPKSTDKLKFRWTNRLVLKKENEIGRNLENAVDIKLIKIGYLNETSDPSILAKTLNKMIEDDSGGSLRDTFDNDELSNGVNSVLLSTMYIRGQWRSAPTLLNDSRVFEDDHSNKTTRMLRINDVIGYADLEELNAQAIELSYATPGLSLLMFVPRSSSLKSLAETLTMRPLPMLVEKLKRTRAGVSMPLYTLRMTLLLPSKLRNMGINKLMSEGQPNNVSLKLSHAVQRIMFWSEAGRHAYKDDGIEWDEPPEMELVIDRPYVFFVRWHNVTLMSGNFVL